MGFPPLGRFGFQYSTAEGLCTGPRWAGPQAARPPGGQAGFARFGGSAAGPAARPPAPCTVPKGKRPSRNRRVSVKQLILRMA